MAVYARGIVALSTIVREANPELAQAILWITLRFAERGFETAFIANDTDKSDVQFWKHGAYLFSFIVNKGDLLFYLRKGTLGKTPDPEDFEVTHKSNGERTLRIYNLTDAEKLMEQLK